MSGKRYVPRVLTPSQEWCLHYENARAEALIWCKNRPTRIIKERRARVGRTAKEANFEEPTSSGTLVGLTDVLAERNAL